MKTNTLIKSSACLCLAAIFAITTAQAQDPAADPLVRNPIIYKGAAPQQEAPKSSTAIISLCYETFSLPLNDAAALYRQKLDDTQMYAELVSRIANGKAKQESLNMIRRISGPKTTIECISERIYPTEYQPAGDPNSKGADTKQAAPAPVQATIFSPALPSAFDTRNTGATFEMEASIAEDKSIALRFFNEFVTLAGRDEFGQSVSETELPNFEVQRLNSSTILKTGKPHLLGTMNRPPVSKIDADAANKVWFAFVTADILPSDKEK